MLYIDTLSLSFYFPREGLENEKNYLSSETSVTCRSAAETKGQPGRIEFIPSFHCRS